MVGVMALFRVPVNLVTSIFVAVLVGLTGDNAIQFVFAARAGRKRQQAGASDLSGQGRSGPCSELEKTAATAPTRQELVAGVEERSLPATQLLALLSLASLTFLGMSLLSLRVLGALFSAGFAMTLVGDLWFLRGLLGVLRGPENQSRKASPNRGEA
jgi:hypothetical protein